ncbi:MAG: adenosylmethionine decarboxylase [Candidatus Omnitrophota bacterium]|jgi:S-adenosylmethionine decarboxylase proenzyme
MQKSNSCMSHLDTMLGKHAIVEYYGCSQESLNDIPLLRSALITAAKIAGATVIDSFFHEFSPCGITGVVVVAESHLSIHTWPEYGYAAVDVFTCGKTIDNCKAVEFIKNEISAQKYELVEFRRGKLSQCLSVASLMSKDFKKMTDNR